MFRSGLFLAYILIIKEHLYRYHITRGGDMIRIPVLVGLQSPVAK